ncbi:MAG: hypothetical protein GX607_21620 [Myxococcales bacterium]|nr:hypothetical protein [Myxococcales bacterium]
MARAPLASAAWPQLNFEAWKESGDTLHMWLQIVGKVRLVLSPPLNHSWHATFYVTPRGITTSPIPYGSRLFQVDLDFLDHRLALQTSDGRLGGFPLEAIPVAEFHERFFRALGELGITVKIDPRPNEVPDPIPFVEDHRERAYRQDEVQRFWQALTQSTRVFEVFRSRFIGKCSPVHLFWGALDLAVTRFSGRPAPPHPGGIPHLPDRVTREAYSHEVSSSGFWGGGGPVPHAAFYAYAYPAPEGYADAKLEPAAAYYNQDLKEFVLPYEAVRSAESPDETLLSFLQSSYEAAAGLARWDRQALEWTPPSRTGA